MQNLRTRTKKLVMIAMFIAIIFAQEEALTVIPNVQLTVLLLMVYGAVVGPLWGTVIVLAHCLFDNLFMASLNNGARAQCLSVSQVYAVERCTCPSTISHVVTSLSMSYPVSHFEKVSKTIPLIINLKLTG